MCWKVHVEFNNRSNFFHRRLERCFLLVFVIVPGLKLMMGFARKSWLSFLLVHNVPVQSCLLVYGQYTVLACSVARFGRETDKHKLIVRKKTWKGQTKFDMWGKRLWKKQTKKLIVRKKTCKPFCCCCCNKSVYNFWKRPPTNATTKCNEWMLSGFLAAIEHYKIVSKRVFKGGKKKKPQNHQ